MFPDSQQTILVNHNIADKSAHEMKRRKDAELKLNLGKGLK